MTVFDERTAIQLEIQTLKEQTRMDYDLYFESRKVRNEQIANLLDRLRQLDERDNQLKQEVPKRIHRLTIRKPQELTTQQPIPVLESETITSTVKQTDAISQIPLQASKLLEELKNINRESKTQPKEGEEEAPKEDFNKRLKKEKIKENIQKELAKHSRRGTVRVPIEKIETVITQFLLENDSEQRMKDIQTHAEEVLGTTWKNFHSLFNRVSERNTRIKKGSNRGTYTIDK